MVCLCAAEPILANHTDVSGNTVKAHRERADVDIRRMVNVSFV